MFHSMDSFEKHRRLLQDFQFSPASVLVKICGEPQHNFFALRAACSPKANDYRDFLTDHQDLLARPSAAAAPSILVSI